MNQNVPLYNSRLLTTYTKLLRDKYPDVSISEILACSSIEPHEITDEGCWFTQSQVDRFHEISVQLTGNKNIAREAGRIAASPGAIGTMRQYTFGLLGPSVVFKTLNRAGKKFTRSSEYESRPLKHNQVEIKVKPHEGVNEKLFQCENRMGFFEAIIDGFHLGLPKIEHPECLFQGGSCCRYIVTWKRTLSSLFCSVRNVFIALLILSVVPGVFIFSFTSFLYCFISVLFLCLGVSLTTEFLRRKEIMRSMENLWDSSERLTDLIDTSARNVQLVHEIGQALVNKKSVKDVLNTITQVMESGLDFDCGAILLANQKKTRLEIRSSFGYSHEDFDSFLSTSFSLNKLRSEEPFVQAFQQQKNFIINNTKEIEEKLPTKSRKFIQNLGVHSFVCCPIVVEGESLGVIAVTNQTAERPLVSNDINVLQGIAPTIGVALQNVGLIEELHSSFEKTLKVLADSIDARDYLTAGHSEVVTEYAAGIAKEMGQSDEYIKMIRIAGLLHDYGKIGVPDSILKKNGLLTPEERDIINTHPARTQQILSQVPFRGLHTQIPVITGAHHERWDGGGYPTGLRGENIPFGARILAVADFFEAITSKRHYRDPMPLDKALELLRESSGSHFDPEVVTAFLTYLKSRNFSVVTPSSHEYKHAAIVESRQRVPCVEYRTQISARQGQQVLTGDIINIGEDGVYIASTDPAEEHKTLVLTFALPGSDEYIQIPGTVSWINSKQIRTSTNHPEGFAVHFDQIPEQAQILINQFVSQELSRTTGRSKRMESDNDK